MPINQQQLLQILPNAGPKAGVFVPALNIAMTRYTINTRLRIAAFIAQIGHESGQLRYVRELGSDSYLAKYDTGQLALRLGNTPEADGDGQLYRGRGLIQVTGRANYEACGRRWGWTCCASRNCLNSRSMPPCRQRGSGTVPTSTRWQTRVIF